MPSFQILHLLIWTICHTAHTHSNRLSYSRLFDIFLDDSDSLDFDLLAAIFDDSSEEEVGSSSDIEDSIDLTDYLEDSADFSEYNLGEQQELFDPSLPVISTSHHVPYEFDRENSEDDVGGRNIFENMAFTCFGLCGADCSNPVATHGETLTRDSYKSTEVNAPATCDDPQNVVQQTNECDDGRWSDWAPLRSQGNTRGELLVQNCNVKAQCDSSRHGEMQIQKMYEHGAVMKPATCDASSVTQRRTCDDGAWSAWAPASAFTNTNCVHNHPGHAMVVGMECEIQGYGWVHPWFDNSAVTDSSLGPGKYSVNGRPFFHTRAIHSYLSNNCGFYYGSVFARIVYTHIGKKNILWSITGEEHCMVEFVGPALNVFIAEDETNIRCAALFMHEMKFTVKPDRTMGDLIDEVMNTMHTKWKTRCPGTFSREQEPLFTPTNTINEENTHRIFVPMDPTTQKAKDFDVFEAKVPSEGAMRWNIENDTKWPGPEGDMGPSGADAKALTRYDLTRDPILSFQANIDVPIHIWNPEWEGEILSSDTLNPLGYDTQLLHVLHHYPKTVNCLKANIDEPGYLGLTCMWLEALLTDNEEEYKRWDNDEKIARYTNEKRWDGGLTKNRWNWLPKHKIGPLETLHKQGVKFMDHVLGDGITAVLGLSRDRRARWGSVRGGPRSFSVRDKEGTYLMPIHVIETRLSNAGLHLMNGGDRWLMTAMSMDAWGVAEKFTNDIKEFQTKAYDMAIQLSAANGGKFNVMASPKAGVEKCLDIFKDELLETKVGFSRPLQKRNRRSSSSDSFDFDSFDFDSYSSSSESSDSSSSESSDSYSSSDDDDLIDLLDELLSAF